MTLKPNSWYAVVAKSADEAEVMIYDEIGMFGVSAKQFVTDVKGIDAKRITVALNTPGGDVFDGIAIYNALRQHDATINVRIDGLAASCGSLIAMAGDTIEMAANAYLMIHNPWTFAVGDAADMRKQADVLDKLEGTTGRDLRHPQRRRPQGRPPDDGRRDVAHRRRRDRRRLRQQQT
jgi:ATP-dependent protease ClpP protease subunit